MDPIVGTNVSNPYITQSLQCCKFDIAAPLWARLAALRRMKLHCNAYVVKADINHMVWKKGQGPLKTYGAGESYPVNLQRFLGKHKTFYIPGSYSQVTGSHRLIKVPLSEVDAFFVNQKNIIVYPKMNAAFFYRSHGQYPQYLGTNPYTTMPQNGISFFFKPQSSSNVGEAVSQNKGTRLECFYPHKNVLKEIEMSFAQYFPDYPELSVEWALQKEAISRKLLKTAGK